MNVPQLRFKGFEGEWRKVELGELLIETKELKRGDSNIPIATSSRKGLFLQSDYFNGKRSYDTKSIEFKVVPKNYITYRHMSDDSTFHFNLNNIADEILVSPEYPVFKTNEKANIQFILNHLNSASKFKKFCEMQKLGGTRTRLYFNKLIKYSLKVPSISEQNKITSFLALQDKKIEKQKEKVEKLEQFKKGIMQKIFSQELRFKDEDGGEFPEWEEYKLEYLLAKIAAGATPSTLIPEYWNGNIPWASSGEVNLRNIYDVEKRITKKGFDNSSTLIIPVGSVLIALAGQGKTRGKVAINHLELTTNQSLAALMPNEKLLATYLFFNLEHRYEELRSLSAGDGGRGGLNLKLLRNLNLRTPSLEEQTKISNVLLMLDRKIEKENESLSLMVDQKKGYLQRIFI